MSVCPHWTQRTWFFSFFFLFLSCEFLAQAFLDQRGLICKKEGFLIMARMRGKALKKVSAILSCWLFLTCNRVFKGFLNEVIQPASLRHFPPHEFFHKSLGTALENAGVSIKGCIMDHKKETSLPSSSELRIYLISPCLEVFRWAVNIARFHLQSPERCRSQWSLHPGPWQKLNNSCTSSILANLPGGWK